MHDGSISISRLVTAAFWTLSVALLALAWVVWLTDHRSLALMLGTSTLLTVAVAAVSQIRCYSLRICGLLRTVGGLEAPASADLRSLR